MVRTARRASGSRSHRRIADLRERARFAPEALEARKLLAVIAWDGDAGDGDFVNPLNWDGDVMPGVGDDAIIGPGAGPFIELRAGDIASLKSLVVEWPLAVNGTLGVSESMTVGAVFFDIGEFGRLESSNIHIQAGTGGIWNQGEWTIGGTSVIERRVLSDGLIRIANDAQVTLGPGLNANQQRGIFEVRAGYMAIGDNVTLAGVGSAEPQLIVETMLNVDGAATFTGLTVVARGTGLSDNVRINFTLSAPSTIVDSTVTFEYALVQGAVAIQDSQVMVRQRAIFFGEATVQGGTLDVDGALIARTPAGSPGAPNSFAIENSDIDLRGWLHGNITVTGTQITAEPDRTMSLGHGLTLHDVSIVSDSTHNFRPNLWTVDGLLAATGLTTSGFSVMRVNPGATLRLEGSDQHTLGTLFRVGGTILWTGGDLGVSTAVSVARWTAIDPGGEFLATFAGAEQRRLDIAGTGQFRVRGEFIATFDDPAGELVVSGRFYNRGGLVEVTGGLLRFEDGLVNTEDGRLGGSGAAWIAGPGATIEFDEAITTNAVDVTVIDDGRIPGLASITLNTGVITLEGEGGWASGLAAPFTMRNYGEIRKTGDGLRTISGAITNLVAGTVAVESGHVVVDSPLFVNRGLLSIGSNQFMSPRAVFSVTGDYSEGVHAELEIIGVADGDAEDLPRLGVGGTMSLRGDLRISMSTSTPFAQTIAWQLGFASTGLAGRFGSVLLTLPGTQSSVVYTGQRFLVTIEV